MENPSQLPSGPTCHPSAVRILCPKLDQPVYIRFLGAYRGLQTHYLRGKSSVCPGAASCPPGDHKSRSVWRGYAPVEEWIPAAKVWRAAVLELTESAEEYVRGRNLRGEVWYFERGGEVQSKSAVTGVFCEAVSAEQLPAAFGVEAILKRFYRVASLPPDTENQLPSKVFLPDSPGAPPAGAGNLAAAAALPEPKGIRQRAAKREAKEEVQQPATAEQWEKLRAARNGIGK